MSLTALLLSFLIATFLFLSLVLVVFRLKPKRIFNIYPTKGFLFYVKYLLALQGLKYYNSRFLKKRAKFDDDSATIDGPQVFSDDPRSYDQISFVGSSAEGHRLMVYMERRKKGVFYTTLCVYIPELGLFAPDHLPDMLQFTEHGEKESDSFTCNGLTITCLETMKKWKIRFEGDLVNKKRSYATSIDATFEGTAEYFNHNTDFSRFVIADSLARESWDDDFFHVIKNVDEITKYREHYEQVGHIAGKFKIGDVLDLDLKMQGHRNHSFGSERFLETVHRYAYFTLFLSDGTYAVLGALSQPSFFLSSLKVGYVCTPDGKYHPIKSNSFELFSYGEKGTPPKHKNFYFQTEHEEYLVAIDAEACTTRYFGYDWEIKLNNQYVTCSVNGVPGFGLTEYLYKNRTGRPSIVERQDPQWFQRIRTFERTLSYKSDFDDDLDSEDDF